MQADVPGNHSATGPEQSTVDQLELGYEFAVVARAKQSVAVLKAATREMGWRSTPVALVQQSVVAAAEGADCAEPEVVVVVGDGP